MVLIAAITCLTLSIVFVILYGMIIDINNPLGLNIWIGIFSVAFLAIAGIVLEIGHDEKAEIFATFAYSLSSLVILWRIKIMLKLARENKLRNRDADKCNPSAS